MKYALLILVISFVSCGRKTTKLRGEDPTDADTSKTTVQIEQSSVCYISLSGNAKQDSSVLHLNLNGDNVSGKFYSIPYQKDARIGNITGKRVGDTIKVMWSYMQEGMNQSLPAEFLVMKNKLLQKEYSYDSKTGAEVLKPDAKFKKEYEGMNCEDFPERK